MNTIKLYIILFAISTSFLYGQTSWSSPYERIVEENNYTESAMIFLNDEVLKVYFVPEGMCKVPSAEKGIISLNTVLKTDDDITKIKSIPFHVVILNRETNTMRLFSTETFDSIDLQEIVRDCEMNDDILIVTNDKKYSLGNHRINLEWGC